MSRTKPRHVDVQMCAPFIPPSARFCRQRPTILWLMSPFRPAEPDDAASLVALQRSIYQEGRWFVGDGPVAVETLARRLRALDETMSLFLVAATPELAGWLELSRLTPARLRHVAVLTLAVGAPWRRRGLGRGLLERAYPWAKRVGVEKVQLNVRSNNHAALSLYESQGFTVEGREVRQIREGNAYEDNLIMAKFLSQ